MEQKPTTEVHDELGIVSVNKRIGTRRTDSWKTGVPGRGRVGDGDRPPDGHEPMARLSNRRSRERGASGEGREQTGTGWAETGLRVGPPLSASQQFLDNWQAHISRSLPRARDGRAKAGAWNERDGEADASWAGNTTEEDHREQHARVDLRGTRFSLIPMRRLVQQLNTGKTREPRRPLHWYVICSAALADLSRWIQPVRWSGERKRSRLGTSPVRGLIRDRQDQELAMECHPWA